MSRFRFRLEVSLRLAEQVLDQARIHLAQETERYQACLAARDVQQGSWQEALHGQREAGSREPEYLSLWRAYTEKMVAILKIREQELLAQTECQEKARLAVIEAHREVEKLKRLKEKQREVFEREALRQEQKVLDETGQVLYQRLQIVNHEHQTWTVDRRTVPVSTSGLRTTNHEPRTTNIKYRIGVNPIDCRDPVEWKDLLSESGFDRNDGNNPGHRADADGWK